MFKKGLLAILLTIPFVAQATEDHDPLRLRCAVDLCGPARDLSKFRSQGTFGEIAPMSTKKFLGQELNPFLSKTGFSLKNMEQMKVEIAREIEGKISRLNVSNSTRAFLAFVVSLDLVMRHADEVMESSGGNNFRINLEKMVELAKGQDPAQVKAMGTAVNGFLGSTSLMYSSFAGSAGFERYMRTVLQKENPFPDEKQIYLESLILPVLKIEKEFGRFAFRGYDTSLFLRDSVKNPFSKSEEQEIMEIISLFYAYQAFQSVNVQAALSNVKGDAGTLLRSVNFGEVLKNREESLDQAHQAMEMHKFGVQCQKAATRFLSAAPSDLRLRKSLEVLEQVKASVREVLPDFFSGNNLESAKALLGRMKVQTPPTQQVIEAELRRILQIESRKIARRENQLKELMSPKSDDSEKLMLVIREMLMGDKEEGDSEFKDLCEALEPKAIEDRAYQAEGSMVLSWQSATFPDFGAGVMAHEIGHLISYHLPDKVSAKRFGQIRACSALRHQEMLSAAAPVSQYEEEDWADDFAISVLKKMRPSSVRAANYACGLMGDAKGEDFGSLLFVNPMGIDTHSESLLRAFRIHQALGGALPASCLKAIGPEWDRVKAMSCE